jgi:hypothetical protein
MGLLAVYIKNQRSLGPEPYLGSSPFLQSFFTPLPIRKEMAEFYSIGQKIAPARVRMTRNTVHWRKDRFNPMIQ